MADKQDELETTVVDILHRHYYPTMHEQVSDASLLECAKQLIPIIKEALEEELIKGNPETVWGKLRDIIDRKERAERERIAKDLHNLEFESNSATDFLNKTIYYIRQALKGKEVG